jgi:hypothetical protein
MDVKPLVMDRDDRMRISELCAQLAEERDPDKFAALVMELDRVLAARQERLENRMPERSN